MGNFLIEERVEDKAIVMTPKSVANPEHTLIWLHGYGVDIEDAKFPLSVERNKMPNVKIVMPRPPDNKEWDPITGVTYWYDSNKSLGPSDLNMKDKPNFYDVTGRWD